MATNFIVASRLFMAATSTSPASIVFTDSRNFERVLSPHVVVRRGRPHSVIGFLMRSLLLLGVVV
jgi:hypothetical protein